MAKTEIFISYRRNDAGGYAHSLHARLRGYFGTKLFWADFVDPDNLPSGAKYRELILKEVDASSVVLVVIGPDWLNDENRGRLNESDDMVREEVNLALDGNKKVIPVLVGGAESLSKNKTLLPGKGNKADDHTDLKRLVDRQEHELSHSRPDFDLKRLREQIRIGLPKPLQRRILARYWFPKLAAGAAFPVALYYFVLRSTCVVPGNRNVYEDGIWGVVRDENDCAISGADVTLIEIDGQAPASDGELSAKTTKEGLYHFEIPLKPNTVIPLKMRISSQGRTLRDGRVYCTPPGGKKKGCDADWYPLKGEDP